MSYDESIVGSGEDMIDAGDVDDETGYTGGSSFAGSGPTMTEEEGSWDDEPGGGTSSSIPGSGNDDTTIWDMLEVEHDERTPVEIGSPGCFDNVIEKQQNPPTQNSKFLNYQVKKQENQAATTKLFAFGRFM